MRVLFTEVCLSCSYFPHIHLGYSLIQGYISFYTMWIYAYPVRSTLLPLWSAGWASHRRSTTRLNFWSNQMCSKLIWSLVLCESILFTRLPERCKHKGNFCTRQNCIGLHILCTTSSLQVKLYIASLVGLCVLSRPHSQKIVTRWLLYSRWFTNVKGSISKDKRMIKRQLYSRLWEKYLFYLSTLIVRTQCSALLPVLTRLDH